MIYFQLLNLLKNEFKMKKILHVVGARPQFMKLLPLYIEMKKQKLDQEILHTGQHFDESMSKVFFDQLGIPSLTFI